MNNKSTNDSLSQTDGPMIQRVVNIKSLRFQSVKNVEEKYAPALDLNKLNAQRKFSLDQREYDEYKKSLIRKADHTTYSEPNAESESKDEKSESQFIRHVSELEINENENIVKTNPLFKSDDLTQSNKESSESNENETPFINRIYVQNSSSSLNSQNNATSDEVNEYDEPIYVDPIDLIDVEPKLTNQKESELRTVQSDSKLNAKFQNDLANLKAKEKHSQSLLSKLNMQTYNIQERKDTEIFEQVAWFSFNLL